MSYPVSVSQVVKLRQGLLCLWLIFPKLLQHLLAQGKVRVAGCGPPAGLPIWGHFLTTWATIPPAKRTSEHFS